MSKDLKINSQLAMFFLLVVGFCVYFNGLGNDFVWDDKYLIVDNTFIRGFSHIKEIFSHHLFYFSRLPVLHYYRPIQTLSYLVDYHFWGLNPFGYHLTNVLLQIVNSFLLFCFVDGLCKNRRLAFLAALLFLIHPLHNAAVDYISGRADLLVTALLLAALISFAKFIIEGKFIHYLSVLILFFFALLTKEISLFLPFLLILVYFFICNQANKRNLLRIFMITVPFLIVGGAFVSHNLYVSEEWFIPQNILGVSWFKLFTWLKIVFLYIGLTFLPVNLHMERATSMITSFSEPVIWVLIAGLLGILVLLRWVYRHSRTSFFGLAWFFLTLIPVYYAMYFNADLFKKDMAIMAEHWLYWPLLGLSIFLASEMDIINAKPSRFIKATINSVFLVMMVFFALQTVKMNYTWRNDATLFKHTLRFAKYSYKPYVFLGRIYLQQGEVDKSISLFQRGIAENPEAARLRTNLGMAYENKGDFTAATKEYQKAIQLDPFDFYAYNNLGVIYTKSKQMKQAQEYWKKALEINPNFDLAHHNLVLALRDDQEIKRYKTKLDKEPLNLDINQQLAGYYMSKGLYPEAIEVLNRCLIINPRSGMTYNMLGFVYVQFKYLKQAERYFKMAIQVDPLFAEAYNNLGALYATLGKYRQARIIWQKGIEINPGYEVIRQNLRQLQE